MSKSIMSWASTMRQQVGRELEDYERMKALVRSHTHDGTLLGVDIDAYHPLGERALTCNRCFDLDLGDGIWISLGVSRNLFVSNSGDIELMFLCHIDGHTRYGVSSEYKPWATKKILVELEGLFLNENCEFLGEDGGSSGIIRINDQERGYDINLFPWSSDEYLEEVHKVGGCGQRKIFRV